MVAEHGQVTLSLASPTSLPIGQRESPRLQICQLYSMQVIFGQMTQIQGPSGSGLDLKKEFLPNLSQCFGAGGWCHTFSERGG